jgi:acetylornithine deacetylase/succinyl-diaminopimelate desuccinylase-like protein
MLKALRSACLWVAAMQALPACATAADPAAIAAETRAWRTAHEAAILQEFRQLLTLPNVSSDAAGIAKNAAALQTMFERRGLRCERWSIDGCSPLVFAELPCEDAEWTILWYAHYDGQPVDLESWHSPPFEPTLRDGKLEEGAAIHDWSILEQEDVPPNWRIYARGTADDKAPIIALLAALDALKAAGRAPSIHVKIILEGEEEAGSNHLAAMLAEHAEAWKADAMLLCDGPVHPSGKLQLVLGARGVVGLEMTTYGPARPLHSGHYGNWAPNPAARIASLLASMRAQDGTALVAGFDEDVRVPTEAELAWVAACPAIAEPLLHQYEIAAAEHPAERPERAILRPAINVRGLSSGNVGERARNAIPSTATASIDFRMVPDQTPEKVRRQVEAHLLALGCTVLHDEPTEEQRRTLPDLVRLSWGKGYAPARSSLDHPFCAELVARTRAVLGNDLVVLPTLGGSVPIHLFQQVHAIPVVILPIANHDNNQHAPDENLRIGHLWSGIELFAALLATL